jgi:uncharacterized membrane protein YoaK (UPF0700 family)
VDERNPAIHEPLPRTLLALTFVTGMVDAVSFLALGQVFAAMMTGNVLFLGFGIAGATGSSLVAPAVAIVAFVVGGLTGGVVAARTPDDPPRGLTAGIAVELLALGAATALAAAITVEMDEASAWVLIAILAFGMGARSTVVRRMGIFELQTNVLFVALSSFEAGTSFAGASPSHLVPRAAAIAAMLAGAVAGALLWDGVSLTAALAVATAGSLLAGTAYALSVKVAPA